MASKNIPLRLTSETVGRLDDIARRLGMTRSGVIKFCTKSFLDDFERRGTAILPGNWREILHSYDGRVARHQNLLVAEEVKGPVTQIGSQQNFSSGARPAGKSAPYKTKRPKK